MDGFAAEEQSWVVASSEDGDAVADTYPPLLVLLPGDDDDLPLSKRQLVVIIGLTLVDGFHPPDFTPRLQSRDRTSSQRASSHQNHLSIRNTLTELTFRGSGTGVSPAPSASSVAGPGNGSPCWMDDWLSPADILDL